MSILSKHYVCYRTRRNVRRAFTLVELAVATLIASTMFLGLAGTLYYQYAAWERADDAAAAQARAERVFATLKMPLDHCGYGMPKDAGTYRSAYRMEGLEPFGWPGPLSIVPSVIGGVLREGGTCRIAYAVSTNVRATAEIATSQDTLEVRTNEVPSLLEGTFVHARPLSVKNWALFGAMLPDCRPLWLVGAPRSIAGGFVLTFKWNKPPHPDARLVIPENDELLYFRAIKCQVSVMGNDYAFFTNDHTGSGWQPRITGVADARFKLLDGGRLVRVHLLTRGNKRYQTPVTLGTPQNWPEAYAADIPDSMRHYRLYAHTATFELKNF